MRRWRRWAFRRPCLSVPGHSAGVAELATAAAAAVSVTDLVAIRRAALVHDVEASRGPGPHLANGSTADTG